MNVNRVFWSTPNNRYENEVLIDRLCFEGHLMISKKILSKFCDALFGSFEFLFATGLVEIAHVLQNDSFSGLN